MLRYTKYPRLFYMLCWNIYTYFYVSTCWQSTKYTRKFHVILDMISWRFLINNKCTCKCPRQVTWIRDSFEVCMKVTGSNDLPKLFLVYRHGTDVNSTLILRYMFAHGHNKLYFAELHNMGCWRLLDLSWLYTRSQSEHIGLHMCLTNITLFNRKELLWFAISNTVYKAKLALFTWVINCYTAVMWTSRSS